MIRRGFVPPARRERICRIEDRALLRRFLESDRACCAYLLGDLVEPYWSQSAFFGCFADASDASLRAVLLKYAGIDPPPVLSIGEAEAVEALYEVLTAQGELTHIFFHTLPEHQPSVEARFLSYDATDMWRMVCTGDRYTAPAALHRARRLTAGDAATMRIASEVGLRDLDDAGGAVSAVFGQGVFYGVEEAGEIVALAGTHIAAPEVGIGAVGFVFTYPEWRGRGYAQACTAAVTRDLLAMGCSLVALNVRQDNGPAVRAYERLGYTIHNALREGTGRCRS
jgi:ribosomal protein S18 acetylase RimI-like enzyme